MPRTQLSFTITKSTVWSFAFSALAHLAVIGFFYYSYVHGVTPFRFSVMAQPGANTMAAEFIPSQEDQSPELTALGLDSMVSAEPIEISAETMEAMTAKLINEFRSPPIKMVVKKVPSEQIASVDSDQVNVAAKIERPPTSEVVNDKDPVKDQASAAEKFRPVTKPIENQQPTAKSGNKSGTAITADAKTSNPPASKVGPKRDLVRGQNGSVASPPGAADDRAVLSGGIPKPHYPEELRRQRIEGRVLVEVKVSPDGRFTNYKIKEGSGQPLFDAAALNSIQQATRVQPAMKNGVAIETVEVIPFVFQLQK